MSAPLGTPIELIAINRDQMTTWREPGSVWSDKWVVIVGHGVNCTHSTRHSDLTDALDMIRTLATTQEGNR